MTAYFDNAATTRPSPAVLSRFAAAAGVFGNPASLHGAGFEAERLLNGAAAEIAGFLGCEPGELVFTSGGTESNNLALLGAARRGDVVTMETEHPSVFLAAKARNADGSGVCAVKPGAGGHIDMAALERAVDAQTALVSVMAVNNEVGTIQPVAEIGALVKRKNPKALFHVDGVQAFGKIQAPLKNIDLYSFSGHKLHGLKGAGGLFVRAGVHLSPILFGGGHQRGLRPGTQSPAAVCALAEAAREAFADMGGHAARAAAVRDVVAAGVMAMGGVVNSAEPCSPYILNVSFPGVMPEPLLHALSGAGVYVSAGSACSTRAKAKHPRFEAYYGWPKALAASAVRFSFSWDNTAEEAAYAVEALGRILPTLVKMR